MISQVVIVAGGPGTRLAGMLPGLPKVLAPVGGRPFLGHVLDLLAVQDIPSIHLCLGHRADQVIAYLEERPPDSLKVTASVEDTPLGTAGCLREANLEEEFVLLLGDTYTPVDLAGLVERWYATGREAAMVVLHNQDRLVPSNTEVRDGLVVRYDKAAEGLEYVDYGIALLRRASLSRLPPGPADLGTLFRSLIEDGELAALEVHQRFYEIGSPVSHAEFARLVDGRPPKQRISTRQVFSSPWMQLREDEVRLADGSIEPFAMVTRADSVLVLCRLDDGSLVMTRQFRYAAGRWSLELPQGGVLPGESATDAALRELAEETGWIGAAPRVLAERLYEAADWAAQSFAVVEVRAVRRDVARLEAGELGAETWCVPPSLLARHIADGLVFDAATLAALLLHRSDQKGEAEA
ncbi:NUDIX domain-containing protein [Frankia sp. CiP1_Cm_nod2]|uniref:NUDIX domain-containing protein n=1 Tax=Frankia sp. CiP1_Cm_nod2 TaxID=2897161 RepID=UPI0020248BFA